MSVCLTREMGKPSPEKAYHLIATVAGVRTLFIAFHYTGLRRFFKVKTRA